MHQLHDLSGASPIEQAYLARENVRIALQDVGAALRTDPEAQQFPQLTTCRFCKRILRRNNADEKWTNYGVAGTTSTECEKAPNPDDGPMPLHEPGTKILTPPDEPTEHTDPATLPVPAIPEIPFTRGN